MKGDFNKERKCYCVKSPEIFCDICLQFDTSDETVYHFEYGQ